MILPYPTHVAKHFTIGNMSRQSLLGVFSPRLPPQAPRLLPESHRTQDV